MTDAESRLKTWGHAIKHARQGDAHTILVDPKTGEYRGATDTRTRGELSAKLFFGEHLPRIQGDMPLGDDASFIDAPRPRAAPGAGLDPAALA